jgi:hypothetical protein
MKGAYWNIRGPNKPGRTKTVCDLIKIENLDFLGNRRVRRRVLRTPF